MRVNPLPAFVGALAVMAIVAGVYSGIRYAAGGGDGSPKDRPLFPIPTDVPAADQLPVSADDIQRDAEGKLFVPDRGDGCPYKEVMRETFDGREWVLIGNSTCELYWRYAPDTGEVAPVPVVTPDTSTAPAPPDYEGPTLTPVSPALPTPKPGQAMAAPAAYFEEDADGKYFRPDIGDGCTYEEVSRLTQGSEDWVYLESPTCEPDLLFAPASEQVRAVPPSFKLDSDGKFLKIDRGEGCNYREVSRSTEDGHEWVRLESSTCTGYILFSPTAGEVRTVLPSPTPTPTATPPIKGVPRGDPPSPSEIKLGADGKYFIPDRGDGCPWAEGGRTTLSDGTVVVSFGTPCDARFFWTFRPQTDEVAPAMP